MVIFDSYNTFARVFPVYITILPGVLILFSILPEGFDWTLGGTASIVLLPLSYLFGQIGGDMGKKRESGLWKKWGGPPTTRLLRHSNSELNSITRNEIHNKMRTLGLHIPSWEEQMQNPTEADVYYEACTKRLIGHTRDTKRYPLVFKSLKEYGFRRNIFGLKYIGLTCAVLSFIVCSIITFEGWGTGTQFVKSAVCALIDIVLILVWLLGSTEKAVKLTADRYANFLLEATLNLEAEDGNNSLS